MVKVILNINLFVGVIKEELEYFFNYKFLGYGGIDEVFFKFKYE